MMTKPGLKQAQVSRHALSIHGVACSAAHVSTAARLSTAARVSTRTALTGLLVAGLAACVTEPTVNAPWGSPNPVRAPAPVIESGHPGQPAANAVGDASYPAGAAPAEVAADAGDVPLIAGRIAYVGGPAEIWDARDNGWRAATLNETIGPQSAIRTRTGSRLEVAIGTSSLRLDSGTDLAWTRLDPDHTEVDLDQGSMIVSLRQVAAQAPAGAREAEAAQASAAQPSGGEGADRASGMYPVIVAAGSVTVTLRQAGSTRLHLDQDGRRLTVSPQVEGALVTHGGGQTTMTRGQVLAFDTESGQVVAAALLADAAFEQWSAERDRQAAASTTYRHVSPAMTGAEALDAHGNWQVDPSYGAIWYPTTVAAGWAPYREGRWTWVAPWGWTWVDAAPWGYAPFHYGRWAYVGSRWGWVPGTWAAQPVYSPALVGYYGGGASVTITAGGPAGIGWFPLAPYEPWYPAYRYTPRYLAAVNRPWSGPPRYTAPGRPSAGPYAPPARYRYSESPAAATFVRSPRFGTGGSIDRMPVTADQLRRLPPPSRQTALPTLPGQTIAPPRSGAARYQPPAGQGMNPGYGSFRGAPVGGLPGRDARPGGDSRPGAYLPPRQVGPAAPAGTLQPLPRQEGYRPPSGTYQSPSLDRRPLDPGRAVPRSIDPGPARSAPAPRYSPPPRYTAPSSPAPMRSSPPPSPPRQYSPPSGSGSPRMMYRAPERGASLGPLQTVAWIRAAGPDA